MAPSKGSFNYDWLGDMAESFNNMFSQSKMSTTVTETTEEDNTPGTYRNGPGYHTTKDATGMTLVIDLPGVDPTGLEVWAEGESVIVVSGKKVGGKNASFTARYRLDIGYSTFAATAEAKLGQLHIRVFTASPFVTVKPIPIDIK